MRHKVLYYLSDVSLLRAFMKGAVPFKSTGQSGVI